MVLPEKLQAEDLGKEQANLLAAPPYIDETKLIDNKESTGEKYISATAASVLKPTSTNKKGIQGTEYAVGKKNIVTGEMEGKDDNPKSLGVNHVLLNFDIAALLDTTNTTKTDSFDYNGKIYEYNLEYFEPYFCQVQEYKEKNTDYNDRDVAITFVILLSKPTEKYSYLAYPGSLNNSTGFHIFYALNTKDSQARETLSAVFNFLTKKFGDEKHFVQNWIIGNEVDVPDVYNFSGTHDASVNVNICAQTFQLFYDKMSINSPYAKAYISLTNRWNTNSNGYGIGGKKFLKLFSEKVKTPNWNIAFHAYDPTMQHRIWEKDSLQYLSYSSDSPYICAANLNYMTDYVKNTYGNQHRIILSEQGFNVLNESYDEQMKQAAELVYTYYAAANNDMVDAVIFNNWEDNTDNAVFDGMHIGIRTDNHTPRQSYTAFKFMDTAPEQVEVYRKYINENCTTFPSWTCKILYEEQPTIYIHNPGAIKLSVGLVLPDGGLHTDKKIYRWTEANAQTNQMRIVSDWSGSQVINWKPGGDGKNSGNYVLKCEVITGDQRLYSAEIVYYHEAVGIKGTCVAQNGPKSRLFGIETNKNPNQSLLYEINVLNFEDFQAGKYAWVLLSGKNKVPGNAFWASLSNMKQAVYVAYFKVYDEDGQLLADTFSSFVVYDSETAVERLLNEDNMTYNIKDLYELPNVTEFMKQNDISTDDAILDGVITLETLRKISPTSGILEDRVLTE